MRIRRQEMAGFGVGDTTAAQRIRVARQWGNARLCAVVVDTRSQQDQFFVMSKPIGEPTGAPELPLGVLGVRQPYIVDPIEPPGDLLLAPMGFYPNVALTDPPFCLTRQAVVGMDRYLGVGAFASVVSYYGGMPPTLPIRRDPLLLECQVRITDVNRVAFRVVSAGRDKAAFTVLTEVGGNLVTWSIFGCTESLILGGAAANARERTLLATGGPGKFDQENLDSFDTYEIEMVGPGAVTTDINLRYTAWDS